MRALKNWLLCSWCCDFRYVDQNCVYEGKRIHCQLSELIWLTRFGIGAPADLVCKTLSFWVILTSQVLWTGINLDTKMQIYIQIWILSCHSHCGSACWNCFFFCSVHLHKDARRVPPSHGSSKAPFWLWSSFLCSLYSSLLFSNSKDTWKKTCLYLLKQNVCRPVTRVPRV